MKRFMSLRPAFCCLLLSVAISRNADGQTKVDLREQARNIDFTTAAATRPVKTGTVLPAACAIGEMYFLTNAANGQNLHGCAATNTWAQMSGSSPSSPPDITGQNGKVLVVSGSATAWLAPAGDIDGNINTTVVRKLQGKTVSSVTPFNGQVLSWNAAANSGLGQWERPPFPVVVAAAAAPCPPVSGITVTQVGSDYAVGLDTAVVPAALFASSTLDFPSINSGTCASPLTMNMPGAVAGSALSPGWPAALEAGLMPFMRVSAARYSERLGVQPFRHRRQPRLGNLYRRTRERILAMVFLLFLLVSLFAGLLEAQPAIAGMQSDAITRSTARVGFTTSGSGNFYVQYGTTTSYGFRTSSFGGSGGFVHQMTGMAGGTTYNWRICNESYTPPAGCSANQTLVTLADTDSVPMPAILPATMSTVMPIINGSTFTVASDCSDFMTRINQARAADGNLNHEVRIPASAICVGPYDISPKNGANANGSGYIVIRSASADTDLPPPGVRATRSWESAMPVFVNPSIGDTQQSTDPGGCSPRDCYWNTAATGLNKYRVCTATNVWTAVNVTAGYTESTTQPSTCAVGVYWYNTTNGSSRHSLYRCVAANRWLRLDPRGDGGYAIANNYLTALKGFRFLGLRFEPGDLSGNSVGTLLNIGNYSGMHSNVVVDRCIFYVGPSASAINALSMNGSNIALIDSYLDMRVVPTLVPYNVAGGAQIINITSGTGPFKIVNNYIRGAGILLFVNDNDGAIPRDDFEVRRNTFTYNDAQRCGSPSSDGICRDVRGPMELKRGRRLWLDGNVFENYWSTLGTYPAMIITPRASGSSRFDGNAYQVSDLTITNNIFRKGTGFMEIWSGDDQGTATHVPPSG
jgi:hypothetical protein